MGTAPAFPMQGKLVVRHEKRGYSLKHFWRSRNGFATICILTSAGCTFFLAGLLFGISMISKNSSGSFMLLCELVFLTFFAFPVVSAALLALTRIPEEWSMGFGAGLYYGTFFVAIITRGIGWDIPSSDRFFLGIIISGLVCYIIYQDLMRKKNK